jgi:hypothetical protein
MSAVGFSRRLLLGLLVLGGVFSACPAAGASAAEVGFGFESTGAEESTSVAGLHPDLTTSFTMTNQEIEGQPKANGRLQSASVALPPGVVGNPTQFPHCAIGDFNAFGNCPVASQVGVVAVLPSEFPEKTEPLYNLEPDPNEIAKFGFYAFLYPIFIDVSVRTGSDYGVTATVHDASGQAALIFAKTTLWGVPADPIHDEQRLTPFEAVLGCQTACEAPEGKRSSGLSPLPFLSNPSACETQQVNFTATTYQAPGEVFTGPPAALPDITGCQNLPLEPSLKLETSSHRAGAPTGLSAVLRIPQTDAVGLPASSAMRAARVTLPEDMTIASGAGNALGACSDAQVALGQEVDSSCPADSRLGTATFVSPALPEPLHGAIYQRTPEAGNLFRIWLVTDERGLHLKLPGEIRADASTGRLTAEFQDTPQLPVEEIDLEFKGGDLAPLKNPETCGSFSASYQFTPWSGNPPSTGQTAPIEIHEGCGPTGFSPRLEAGVTNPVAGEYSPFVMNLSREDGEENVAGITMTMPKGELAKLAGVPLCPDSPAASGNCPTGSQIGTVSVAAGPGSQPLWIPQPGKAPTAVYLAGPYKGAPYSVVVKVPAQAGPFDLGTVVVRGGIYVDPETARVTIKADPLPQILEGVPILYRKIHVSIDRDRFTVNPTDCEATSVDASVASAHSAVATPSDRFQVGECAALDFKPKLKLSLKGSTKRIGHPALKATLTANPGEANIARVQVNLPQGEFLDQGNLNKTCTKPVLLAGNCPASSVYGRVKAWTPLLEKPLEGNVYLVGGYGYKLPALVAELNGQIRILLVGKIDSGKNKGIRNTFEVVPDAPVSRFVLELKGGPKYSLLENSEDLCKAPKARRRAIVRFTGQNGKVDDYKPLVQNQCGKR